MRDAILAGAPHSSAYCLPLLVIVHVKVGAMEHDEHQLTVTLEEWGILTINRSHEGNIKTGT